MTALNLDVIQVRKPCPADWDSMAGGDQVRFCGTCCRHVHNLSAMTRADANDLVAFRGDAVCVRFARAAEDGVVQTLDYRPMPPCSPRRHRFRIAAIAASVLAAAAGGWMRWVRQAPPIAVTAPMMGMMVMGDIGPAPTPLVLPVATGVVPVGMSCTPPREAELELRDDPHEPAPSP